MSNDDRPDPLRDVGLLENLAYKDDAGRWRAGPDSKHPEGQIVSAEYAKRARSQRARARAEIGLQRQLNVSREEASRRLTEFKQEWHRGMSQRDVRELRRRILGY